MGDMGSTEAEGEGSRRAVVSSVWQHMGDMAYTGAEGEGSSQQCGVTHGRHGIHGS